MKPIVRNIQNNDLYRFEGGNRFTNIRTGKSGDVSDDLAAKVFKINLDATAICNEYPAVEDFIKRLNLIVDEK